VDPPPLPRARLNAAELEKIIELVATERRAGASGSRIKVGERFLGAGAGHYLCVAAHEGIQASDEPARVATSNTGRSTSCTSRLDTDPFSLAVTTLALVNTTRSGE